MAKFPLSLGQRDRTKQYDKYVKPMSAEDKIVIAQKQHMKCQKLLSKAIKKIDKALSAYSKSTFADSTAITNMAATRKELFMLKEDIKIRTYENLPYSDLNEERKITERDIVGTYSNITTKMKLVIFDVTSNVLLLVSGVLAGNATLIGIGVVMGMLNGLGGYLWWTNPERRRNKKNST